MLVANKMFAADEICSVNSSDESIEKCGKLLKTRKLSKFQKSAKSRKKLSKSENFSNFNVKKNRPSFLTLNAKMAFNHFQLAFTKASILQLFDLKCCIRIETNVLSYANSCMLSKLVFETKPDGVVTKINLGQWQLVTLFLRKIILTKT